MPQTLIAELMHRPQIERGPHVNGIVHRETRRQVQILNTIRDDWDGVAVVWRINLKAETYRISNYSDRRAAVSDVIRYLETGELPADVSARL
jgi:hypothetical protein